jgi:hypothetical protein
MMEYLQKIFVVFLFIFFAAFASAADFMKLHVEDGTLIFEDGTEALLWGVNFQPSLSWEYNRMKQHGLHMPFDMDNYKAMIDEGFDELEMMGCNLIRIHLAPGDITDIAGNLVENRWLELTDYVMAEAEKRGMYTYLAFLNALGSALGNDTFVAAEDNTKPVWMIDPQFMDKADNYMRQLLRRENKYANGVRYKDNPSLVIVEPINEPGYFKRSEIEAYPKCFAVYKSWLDANGQDDDEAGFAAWRIDTSKRYINRMVKFFKDEGCEAVMSWSLEWPRTMEWTGPDIFEAAVQSDAEIVSVCFYPGQSAAHNKTGEDLKAVGEINYFEYIQRSYDQPAWHGWLKDKRFEDKARVVYEFETYYNQSSYLYPAMAKYFRAQGIQAAAMWTYILPGQAEYTAAAHNLNLKTTPNKAAAFMAAGEIMKNTPRFVDYETSSSVDDFSEHAAFSYALGCSAYADDDTLIYSERMPEEFIDHLLPKKPKFKRIVGHGSSPIVRYDGTGLYFIEQTGTGEWSLEILPDAEFLTPHYLHNGRGEKTVQLTDDVSHPFELDLPALGKENRALAQSVPTLGPETQSREAGAIATATERSEEAKTVDVFRLDGNKRERVKTELGSLKFDARPGRYLIRKK